MSEQQNQALPEGEKIPPLGGTRLITDRAQPPSYTANRETDTRTALCRGLKEYVEQLSAAAFGGRDIRFKRVFANWANPEDQALYPSAAIWSNDVGKYDAHAFTPTINPKYIVSQLDIPAPTVLVKLAEFEVELVLDVWANDNKMREEICSMLEAGLSPVDFMYGMRLELPHYFNARAEYEPVSMQYMDDEDNAMRRWRKAQFKIKSHLSVLKAQSYPLAVPKVVLESVALTPLVVSTP